MLPPALAVIELAFDPIADVVGIPVRWQTLAVAGAVLVALLLAARLARITPIDVDADARTGILGPFRDDHLRRDDLLFIVLGIVPGAVIGGRLTAALLHPTFWAADPGALFDPGLGSLELVGAVLGGAASGSIVAGLLEGPVSRWFHLAALPTILAIGLGKVAGVLGGTGQGLPSDLPWATAYLGAGPWASLGPEVAAHPAQVYEALVCAGVVVVLAVLGSFGAFDRRDGRLFASAILLWAMGRFVVGFAWRDPPVAGPLHGGQLVALAGAGIAAVAFWLAPRLARRPERKYLADDPEVAWPDPATRPRF